MRRNCLLGLLPLGFAATSALAAPTAISADPTADWKHEQSGVVLPLQILDMKRSALQDYGNAKLDIFATYPLPGEQGEATIFVFRAGFPNVSVWHDRILVAMGSGRLGQADLAGALRTPFEAPGGGGGYRAVAAMSGRAITSSGISIFASDDWLVAIRMSSATLNRDQLDAKLASLTGALRVPKAKLPATEAYSIEPCGDSLPTKNVKRAQADMAGSLMAALLGSMAEEKAQEAGKEDAPKVIEDKRRFCRDASSNADHGVYRRGAASEGYVIAFGDAGVAAFVSKDSVSELLGGGRNQYSLSLSTVDSRMNYAAFKGLPSVAQAIQAINSERPLSSSNRSPDGKSGNTINIQSQ